MMDQAHTWELPRYVILLIVVMLHLALLALLMMSRTGSFAPAAAHAVELLYLPPAALPAVRSQIPPPGRLDRAASLVLAPTPVFDSSSPSSSPSSASSSAGGPSGVDWAAEKRRALQAFEIRSHQPQSGNFISIDPAEDNWWPRSRHHAGDQFKTACGDGGVWVNARCYQVA